MADACHLSCTGIPVYVRHQVPGVPWHHTGNGTWYSDQSANNQKQEQPSVMQRTRKDALVEYHLRYMVIV